jgi:hypothetical protein
MTRNEARSQVKVKSRAWNDRWYGVKFWKDKISTTKTKKK